MHVSETAPRTAGPHVDVRTQTRGEATELFINVRPQATGELSATAAAMMQAVADVLGRYDASILHERAFGTAEGIAALASARATALNAFDDGVEPTWLLVPDCEFGAISGVQVHAVAGCGRPDVLAVDGMVCGRRLDFGSWGYLVGGNLQAVADGSPAEQTAGMFARTEALLAQAGGSLQDVARTWMWLGGILDWYDEFNRVRNELFAARGMLRPDAGGQMPASTGIGIGPTGRRCCTMDFVATLGEAHPEFVLRAGHQDAASKYGSAFSRAAIARTPAGRTLYISGTAAIDAAGATTHLGDIDGQIRDTLRNVRAVLRDGGARGRQLAGAIVYCKTPQVEQAFRRQWGGLNVPYVLAVADVCRDNLLFEVEATALLL